MELSAIQAALDADKTLREGVLNHVIASQEGQTLLSNAAKQHWTENIGKEVSTIYGNVDGVVKEVLGIEKQADKKTSDFVKEQLIRLNTELAEAKKTGGGSEVEKLKKEIEDLKKGTGSQYWEEKYKNEQKDWQTQIQERDKTITELKTKETKGSISNELNKALGGLKFNETISDGVRKTVIDAKIQQIEALAKHEGDKVVYYRPDGTVWKNPDYTPATAEQILKMELKEILSEGEKPGGGAHQKLPSGDLIKVGEGAAATEELLLDITKLKTQQEVLSEAQKILAAKGVAKNDERYQKIIDNTYVKYKVLELPIK